VLPQVRPAHRHLQPPRVRSAFARPHFLIRFCCGGSPLTSCSISSRSDLASRWHPGLHPGPLSWTGPPISGGFFAGKVAAPDAEAPKGGRFDPDSKMGAMYRARYLKGGYFEALNYLKPIAEKHQLRLTEIALRWCQHHSALTAEDGVILGASSAGQLEQNCQDSEKGPLPEEVVKALDEARMIVGAHAPTYWR